MVGALLARGMIVGVLASLLVFCFLRTAGEPQIEQAIAFETAMEQAQEQAISTQAASRQESAQSSVAKPQPVSRAVQSGLGLLVGVGVYGAAIGGLFALAYALAYGRMGAFSIRATSALLAAAGFIAVCLVPLLKYPANPPAVGSADTIGMRTGLYFALVFISLAMMIAAGVMRLRLSRWLGGWEAALMASGAYILVMTLVLVALPSVNETPERFPADVLWEFRVAAVGAQLIFWSFIGLAFGAWADFAIQRQSGVLLHKQSS